MHFLADLKKEIGIFQLYLLLGVVENTLAPYCCSKLLFAQYDNVSDHVRMA